MKREKVQELSGSEYDVTPLVFDLKENIYFSFREIGVALVPLFRVVVLLLFLFFLFTPLPNNHTYQATNEINTHKIIKKIVGPHFWN